MNIQVPVQITTIMAQMVGQLAKASAAPAPSVAPPLLLSTRSPTHTRQTRKVGNSCQLWVQVVSALGTNRVSFGYKSCQLWVQIVSALGTIRVSPTREEDMSG
jgi:hypothetical protein